MRVCACVCVCEGGAFESAPRAVAVSDAESPPPIANGRQRHLDPARVETARISRSAVRQEAG